MSDSYDAAVEYFLSLDSDSFDEAILEAWENPSEVKGGCLFALAGSNGGDSCWNAGYGCLTQVSSQHYDAESRQLTLEIRDDKRIPTSENGITRDNLNVFAEWQRRLDELYNRPHPGSDLMAVDTER